MQRTPVSSDSDRVDGERGLAGLAIADDQLALAAADRIIESIA